MAVQRNIGNLVWDAVTNRFGVDLSAAQLRPLMQFIPQAESWFYVCLKGGNLELYKFDKNQNRFGCEATFPAGKSPAIREVLQNHVPHLVALEDDKNEEAKISRILPSGEVLVVPLVIGDPYFGLIFRHQSRRILTSILPTVTTWRALVTFGRQWPKSPSRVNEAIRAEAGQAAKWLDACPAKLTRHLVTLAKRVAKTDTAVLINGDTGTGKGVLALALHFWSKRRNGPMVSVNCAALKPELVESELFGHVRGAFTGAAIDRPGRFQVAHGGTLFLDEVGELPLGLQAKLLRVLQAGQFEPLGSNKTIQVDVRLITATNRDLNVALAEGAFREDLYYRLAVFPLTMPSLERRSQDIPAIIHGLFEAWREDGFLNWDPPISEKDYATLQAATWPGNIRELANYLKRAIVLAGDSEHWYLPPLQKRTLSSLTNPNPVTSTRLEDLTRDHILAVLRTTKGRLYGTHGAAEILGLNPSTLRGRMRKLGLGGAKNHKPKHRSFSSLFEHRRASLSCDEEGPEAE